ncbi:hypothetical protein FF1_042837 [Malus domestica]
MSWWTIAWSRVLGRYLSTHNTIFFSLHCRHRIMIGTASARRSERRRRRWSAEVTAPEKKVERGGDGAGEEG